MKRLLVPLLVAMAGCTDSNPQQTFNQIFPNYRGKPIDALRLRWGPPEQSIKAPGGTIYTWAGTEQVTSSGVTTSTGIIGNKTVTVTTPTRETDSVFCRIEAHADDNDRLLGIKFRGNDEACSIWLDRLR